jgi:AcrR family transcriptional regulator
MPRHIDPELELRILQSARRLWHKGGEKALSMRAVARAAGTNTPAVYRRFRSRDEMLRALVQLFQRELLECLKPCASLEEIGEAYLNFALSRPREYELMMSGLLARISKERPNLELVLARASEWLDGAKEEHEALVFALYSILHGCAMLNISGSAAVKRSPKANAAVKQAVEILIANEALFRKLQESGPSGG